MTFQPTDWPPQWPEIRDAVERLFDSGDWGRYKSPHQDELRARLAVLAGVEFVRLCSSGSSAIEICLRAARLNEGDGVALAAFDYPGNFRAIEAVGAVPVLIDVLPNGTSMDPKCLLDNAATLKASGVRALIVSHLFGCAAEIKNLRHWCNEHDCVLIEDACQVPGMLIDGKPAGSFGDLATFSFGGSKPLTAGNGGAVLTNDARLASRIAAMLDRPSDSQPLSTLQSAMLIPQLDRLDACNSLRTATVEFLECEVNPQLRCWRWLSPTDGSVASTHYKVAWECNDVTSAVVQRGRITHAAAELGLPLGASFRSMSNSSHRRCRKPVPLDRSRMLGETAFVLDHSALLIEANQHASLGEHLVRLHDDTSESPSVSG